MTCEIRQEYSPRKWVLPRAYIEACVLGFIGHPHSSNLKRAWILSGCIRNWELVFGGHGFPRSAVSALHGTVILPAGKCKDCGRKTTVTSAKLFQEAQSHDFMKDGIA
jgi:hypothetical protein